MLNQDKIKLMTQLAIYEKNIGKEDFKKSDFFKTDYVSYHNFLNQISVTFALLCVFGIHFAKTVSDHLANITEYNFVALGMKYLTIWAVIIGIFTVLSTIINRVEYSKAKKRLEQYEELLKKLDKIQ